LTVISRLYSGRIRETLRVEKKGAMGDETLYITFFFWSMYCRMSMFDTD